MGTMTFLLPAGLDAEALRELERACVVGGPDNMPWPSRVRVEPDQLIVSRPSDESGALATPWPIAELGRLMGTTATLMDRAEPYNLQLELARGKINQVRCQAADWQSGGLNIPAALNEEIHSANSAFGRAILESPSAQSAEQAQAALHLGYRVADQLARVYMEQVFQVRHEREPKLQVGLGCRLGAVPPASAEDILPRAFNTVAIPFCWSNIERIEGTFDWSVPDAAVDWALTRGLKLSGGPLIDFAAAQLPEWLWLWERDLSTLAKFMANYVSAAVQRYRGRISRWQITSGSNCGSVLSLREEENLWLTVRMAQVARGVAPGSELVFGVAQPWGEYMSMEDRSHSPFMFADAILRSDLNAAAIDIELIMSVTPRGCYCRDLLETSRLLDMYALLGIPIAVTLGFPSHYAYDAAGDPEMRVGTGLWRGPASREIQADWAAIFTRLCLCKPYVQTVYWSHFSDAETHLFPNCGLVDSKGNPKLALEELIRLRETHVQ
jgi:Glycosyl hydrolase family 10